MTGNRNSGIYARIGARPVINAGGNTTIWGGSTPSVSVMRAMEEAGGNFVEMEELLETTGARIADLLDVEAAYVTAGCYAALVLSTAACMTGNDPEKADQRYSYDRAYTVAGGKLVLAGNADGCTRDELEGAIGPHTAAVAYLVRPDDDSAVSLKDTVEIARSHGIPVIADGAAQIYPLDYFRANAQSADLVCFGGKYMGAPHSTGFLCGRKELVQAASAHGFIGPRPLGRGMKIDRQEIVGLVIALEDWLSMDHEERLVSYGSRFSVIERGLEGASGVKQAKVVPVDNFVGLLLHVVLDTERLGKSAQDIAGELLDGTPRIRLGPVGGDDTLVVNVHTLNEGEEHIIADRLRDLLDV